MMAFRVICRRGDVVVFGSKATAHLTTGPRATHVLTLRPSLHRASSASGRSAPVIGVSPGGLRGHGPNVVREKIRHRRAGNRGVWKAHAFDIRIREGSVREEEGGAGRDTRRNGAGEDLHGRR